MVKIHLSSWQIDVIAKTHPNVYKLLHAFEPELGPLEERLEGKKWATLTFYANDINEIPPEILNGAEFSRLRTLELTNSKGDINAEEIALAMQTTQVHLPGNELMQIAEAFVMTNPCTEELNEQLQQGFRIIAVCPQIGQRRPDYVMGRPSANLMKSPEKTHPAIRADIPF